MSIEHQHHHHHHHHHPHNVDWKNLGKQLRYFFNSPFHYWCSVFFHTLAKLPFVFTLSYLILLTLFYNGGESWWLPALTICLFSTYVIWFLSAWWCGGDVAKVRFQRVLLLPLLPLVWGWIQLMPCRWFVKFFSPESWKIWQGVSALNIGKAVETLTLAPDQTLKNCSLLLGCGLLLFYVLSQGHHRLHMRLLFTAIVVAALGNALYEFSLLVSNGMASGGFRGVFLNRNHFGFLMQMGILSCAGMMASISKEDRHSQEEDWKGWHYTMPFFILSLFILLCALVLSFSRGAFLSTIFSLSAFTLLWIFKGGSWKDPQRQKMLAVIVLLVCAVVIALPYAMERLSDRFAQLTAGDITMDTRFLVWKDTLPMIRKFWVTGCGWGAYEDVIQQFVTMDHDSLFVGHAHNDYLEFLAEGGLLFTGTLLLLGLVLWFCVFRRIWSHHEPTYRWVGIASLIAILGSAIHEVVDFSLQAWPNAIVFTSLLGVAALCGRKRSASPRTTMTASERRQKEAEARRLNRVGRFRWRLVFLALALILMMVGIPYECLVLRSALAKDQLRDEVETLQVMEPGSVDFFRRLALANQAMRCYPSDARILHWLALVKIRFVNDNFKVKTQIHNVAVQHISQALMRAPCHALTALACAQIYEYRLNENVRFESDETILKLFVWAKNVSPKTESILSETAMAAYRMYHKSKYLEPEKTSERQQLALQLLKEYLELDPEPPRWLFVLMGDLCHSYEEMLSLAPENYKSRETFCKYLMDSHRLDDADNLLTKMREQFPSEEELKSAPEEAFHKILVWYSLRCSLNEFKGNFALRDQDFLAMMEWLERFKLMKLQDVYTLIDTGENQEARHQLMMMQTNMTLLPDEVTAAISNEMILGKTEAAVYTALLLTYSGCERDISSATIHQALSELVVDENDYWRPVTKQRYSFVKGAFSVLLAEQGDYALLDNGLLELEMLDRLEQEGKLATWSQKHLMYYYLGRGYEIKKRKAEAIAAYQKALFCSPKNLYVLKKIQALAPETLKARERGLLELAQKRPAPLALLNPSVKLLNLYADKTKVESLHDEVTLSALFLCTGARCRQSGFAFSCQDSTGVFWRAFVNDSELLRPMNAWQVGELVVVQQKFTPFLEALNGLMRPLAVGKVFARFSCQVDFNVLESYPSPVGYVFDVGEEKTTHSQK